METIAVKDELLRLMGSKPFVPFQIITSKGDRYKVTRPRSVAVGPNYIFVLPWEGATNRIRLDEISGFKPGRRERKR